MRRLARSNALLCLTAAVLAGAASDFEQLAKLFAYDTSAPLNFQIDGRESAGGAGILTVSYAGAKAPVSAAIVVPSQAGKHPAVVFMTDSGHKRAYFLAEALLLAKAQPPAVSLLIDAPPQRPLGWRRSFNPMLDDNDRDIHIQAVIDVRRGIDLLAARTDVDARSIAYVGQSEGANWGAILSSIEPRLRAFVLIAGYPNLTGPTMSDDPEWADLRYALGNDRFDRYVSSMSAIDPVRYLGRSAGATILFQFGRFDPYVSRARAEALVHAAGRPERAIFYDSGHEVNDPQALLDRVSFLAARIGVGRKRKPSEK
jgi:dienelactone hydrolase